MYQIFTQSQVLGYADDPRFCYLLPSGSPQVVHPKDKDKATGIIYTGTVYNLPGHSDFEGAETATAAECDAGYVLTHQAEQIAQERSTVGGAVAPRMYQPGEYVTVDGTLYRVTLPIPAGGRVAPGTNTVATTVLDELKTTNGYY